MTVLRLHRQKWDGCLHAKEQGTNVLDSQGLAPGWKLQGMALLFWGGTSDPGECRGCLEGEPLSLEKV